MKILVVDDHAENRYMLETILTAAGHTVHPAADGAQALDILKSNGFDLIISDILMPVMDGLRLCRKVKTDARLRAIPFIIHTATYTGSKDQEFAMQIGADRFIEKPCDPDKILSEINAVMAVADDLQDKIQPPAAVTDEDALRLYSERLVRKLEQKMAQAEQEIQARKKAETDLLKNRERLVAAQRLAKMGDFRWDLETGELTWSDALFDLLGYQKSENFDYERVNAQVHHPDDLEQITNWLEAEIASGTDTLTPNEYRLMRRDGTVIHVHTIGEIYRRSGKKPIIFATVQDITDAIQADAEKEKLKAQLFQAQKMESVGRLAGGIAHDYNNMLSVILMYAEMALDRVHQDDDLHTYITAILKAARRSTDITRQLLIFARKQTVTPRVLDLNATITDVLKLLHRIIGEDIALSFEPGTDVWPVRIDPSQVDQVLVNLLVNARDAITGTGKITIQTANETFDAAYCAGHPGFSPGDYAELSVRDDGSGMDKDTVDQIFEPFFTTKDESKGTGLGLATVYGIVKQNKGFISVHSEPGKGTSFTIFLPRHGEQVGKEMDQDTVGIPRGKGETVLLVEDDPPVLKLARTVLETLGYKVLSAAAPREALAQAQKYPDYIHLLLTDVVMPEMNGRQLAEKLLLLRPDIKILYMSGYSTNVITDTGVLEKSTAFINKPFAVRDMAVKVREVLDGRV
ncbi:MAG: response regulator [Desulfotignum sp.]|jgi:PAS domain S-box-containing protein|nr:response regulator [Desulfotignum sp.]